MVKEIEKRVEEGIRADGSCSFDPFEVGIALEFALMVLEMHGRSTGVSQLSCGLGGKKQGAES